MIDNQDLESYMSEEELLDDEDEADMSMLPQDVRPLLRVPVCCFFFFHTYSFFFSTSFIQELVNMIEMLRTKLLAERRRNLTQEMEIRKEMGDAMIQQIMESEELHAYVSVSFFLLSVIGLTTRQSSLGEYNFQR